MRIIKHRSIIRHESPTVRRVSEEITLTSDDAGPIDRINFIYHSYLPGLCAFDDDGVTLPILPNTVNREALENDQSCESRAFLKALNEPSTHVVSVQLPPEHGLKPGCVRVIRLEYVDTATPETEARSFLSIPTFCYEATFKSESGLTHHVVITPPNDFELGLGEISAKATLSDGTERPLTESDHYRKTTAPKIIDAAIPVSSAGTHFKLRYSILPEREEERLFTWLWGGAFFSSLAMLILGIGSPPFVPEVRDHFVGIGGVLLAFCVAFIGLVTNPVTHRTKLWMAIPIIFAGAMIAIGYA